MSIQDIQELKGLNQINENHQQSQPKINKRILISVYAVMLIIILILIFTSHAVMKEHQNIVGSINHLLPIFSGEIHFSRMPHEYWEHRIMMLKAMGLNSLSVYVMWNYHELAKGQFDFENGDKNITNFFELARKHEMRILLRPGPYVCAQWDFGGLPARLLGIQGLQIRANNKYYLDEVLIYFKTLAPFIKPFLQKQGGNIIMIQIENELGYIRETSQHTQTLLNMWKSLGIQSQFYIEDPAKYWSNQYIQGFHVGLSETSHLLKYPNIDVSPTKSDTSLVFSGQFYSGWFTDWGQQWNGRSESQFNDKFFSLVDNNRSFSLYMAFGGTNFGTTAGANGFNILYDYSPHITSYDYDSPVNQQGNPTGKYFFIRKTLQNYYSNKTLIQIPESIKTITIKAFKPSLKAYLFANLPTPALINSSLTYFQSQQLQMYNQGLVYYQTLITNGQKQFIITVRDFAIIYLDNDFITTITRLDNPSYKFKTKCQQLQCKLKIIVEAMGHVNFGEDQGKDRKGLIDITENKNKQITYRWDIYKIPVDSTIQKWNQVNTALPFPALFQTQLNLDEVGDTYLNMNQYSKGYVWVNGHNLGRYWNIGPQQRLYCPGVWLKKGINQIYVLELLSNDPRYITGQRTLK